MNTHIPTTKPAEFALGPYALGLRDLDADGLYQELSAAALYLRQHGVGGDWRGGPEAEAWCAMHRSKAEAAIAAIVATEELDAAAERRLRAAALPSSYTAASITRRGRAYAARNRTFQQRVISEGWPRKRQQAWQKKLLELLKPAMEHFGRDQYYKYNWGDAKLDPVVFERHMSATEAYYNHICKPVETRQQALNHWKKMFWQFNCENSDVVEREATAYKAKAKAAGDPITKQWAQQRLETGLELVDKWRDGIANDAVAAAAERAYRAAEQAHADAGSGDENYAARKEAWDVVCQRRRDRDLAEKAAGYRAIGKRMERAQ